MAESASAARIENRDPGDIPAWPRGVSTTPQYSIGEVVKRLKQEFPAVTTSKVRYLEDEGIVTPARTATRYRMFSERDIERLRFCLATQRDTFMSNRGILQQLQALDNGCEADMPRPARIVASQGELVAPARGDLQMTARELADLTNCDDELLADIVAAGLVTPDMHGLFPQRALAIVHAASALRDFGVPTRNLRYVRTSARRTVDLADQVAGHGRKDRSGAEKERRLAKTREISELLVTLVTELTRVELENLD